MAAAANPLGRPDNAATDNASGASGRLAVLGAGVMGGAICEGALSAGRAPDTVRVTVKLPHERERWEALGVPIAADNAEAVEGADLVLVAVKPHLVAQVLAEVGPHLAKGAVVASVAAGVTLDTIEGALPPGTAAVRVMPNAPALVGAGTSALAAGRAASEEQVARVRGLLDAVGTTVVVAEKDMDAVTALSGSGPAYVYHLAEAMIDGGVLLGLTRAEATALALGTIRGAAAMMTETGTHPTVLREQVVSPGGTTAAALAEMSRGRLHGTVLDAMETCRDRSRQLGA